MVQNGELKEDLITNVRLWIKYLLVKKEVGSTVNGVVSNKKHPVRHSNTRTLVQKRTRAYIIYTYKKTGRC